MCIKIMKPKEFSCSGTCLLGFSLEELYIGHRGSYLYYITDENTSF